MNPTPVFRRALPEEAAALTEIAFAAKQFWGYPDEWLAAWREELTITADMIRGHHVGVAVMSGEIIGTYSLMNHADGWHLEHFWLLPRHIGKGLGRMMFEEAVDHARATGATELHIRSDPHAETFYLKMGAVRTRLEVYRLLGKFSRELPHLTYKL